MAMSGNILGGSGNSGSLSLPFGDVSMAGSRRSSGGGGPMLPNSGINLSADDSGNVSLNSSDSRPSQASSGSASSITESDIITMTVNVPHLRSDVDRLTAQLAIAQQHRESQQLLTSV